jgi:hypothetical protein
MLIGAHDPHLRNGIWSINITAVGVHFFWIFNFDPAGSISILYTLANNIRMVYWINILANIHILILLLAKINNFLPQILLMAENL